MGSPPPGGGVAVATVADGPTSQAGLVLCAGREPSLALSTRAMDQPDVAPNWPVTPGPDRLELIDAAGKLDHLPTGVEQLARLRTQGNDVDQLRLLLVWRGLDREHGAVHGVFVTGEDATAYLAYQIDRLPDSDLEADRGFRDLKSTLLLRPVFHRC
jgi:hypothetical protein